MFTESKIRIVSPILPSEGEEEIWKDITDWEGQYQVSSFGRVRGLDRYVEYKSTLGKHTIGLVSGTIISPSGKKYVQIHLIRDGKIHHKLAHRLVCQCFHPNPLNLPEVNHKDGNPQNNYYKNLEWNTRSQNIQHSYDIGIRKACVKSGKFHPSSKPILQFTKDGILLKGWDNAVCVERELGFSSSAIRSCLLNKTGTSKGFRWKYK